MERKIDTIIIDAGHGGLTKDGKYTTAPNKMHRFQHNGEYAYEGVINRNIAKALAKVIKKKNPYRGMKFFFTVSPNDPTDTSLSKRVNFANEKEAENPGRTILISLHCNAFNTQARGFEIYTSKGQTRSDIYAQEIAKEVKVLYNKRKLKLRFDESDGDLDKESDFYVLRKTNGSAVLIECLFFDNYEDFTLLKDEVFIGKLAEAIYKGIENANNEFD